MEKPNAYILQGPQGNTMAAGTYDDCWLALHKSSSGASTEWLMKYEGYCIRPVGPNHWTRHALEKAGDLAGRDRAGNVYYVVDGKVWVWHVDLRQAINHGDYFEFADRVKAGGITLREGILGS
jgi:hypothetical protein